MDFGRNPTAERLVHGLGGQDGVEQLVHVVKSEVTILQQDPASFGHGLGDDSAGVYLLTLAHRYGATLFTRQQDIS